MKISLYLAIFPLFFCLSGWASSPLDAKYFSTVPKPVIEQALAQVSETNLRETVQWFSTAVPSRFALRPDSNRAVDLLFNRLQNVVKDYPDVKVEKIKPTFFWQQSIRVTVPGKTHPEEILVFGAHLDSINRTFNPPWPAPGADDDGSGVANLIEMLRILLPMERTERTIEFHFYGNEELAMQGSKQVARSYAKLHKDVIGEIQIDMTLKAGDGENTIASYTDFTDPGLRQMLAELNDLYLHLHIIEDVCGYGCSDHVSWYKNGYPTLFPVESTEKNSNHKLHTDKDVINPDSSFTHSALFTKLGLAFILELGNSRVRAKVLTN
jgi:leucyl aminopeptidase